MAQIVYVRNADAGEYFESFLISAVAAILGIRLFLHLAGYPTVGGDALHVAHMLWGGLLMLAALLLLLGFLGKQVKSVAAVVGGLGFGTFIDELGKFLTHDNDYFFQPTAALIYVIFMLMYVWMARLRLKPLSPEESVANALELTLEAVRRDLDEYERARAKALLADRSPGDPVGQALAAALAEVDALADPSPGPVARAATLVRAAYGRAVRNPWFPRVVVGFFVLHSIGALVQTLVLVGGLPRPLSLFAWGELVFSVVPAALVLLGVLRMRTSRLRAYELFRRAVLIVIFVTQFFAFYHNQFVAVVGLALNVVVLATLRFMIHQETVYGGQVE
jgi:hypothetical protein